MDKDAQTVAERLGARLLERGLRVTCAESCTGGGVAEAITSVPGSSQWFDMGFVTYADRAKQQLLGVAGETLKQYGAVSEMVAQEMASGALQAAQADLSVAITGIAGPDGGTADKPVGLVWFAWALREGEVHSLCQYFDGGRAKVRQQAVFRALLGLEQLLSEAGS